MIDSTWWPAAVATGLVVVAYAAGVGAVDNWPALVTAIGTAVIAAFSAGTWLLWQNSRRQRDTKRSQIYSRVLVLRGNLLAFMQGLERGANESVETGQKLLRKQLPLLEEARQEIRDYTNQTAIQDERVLLEMTAAEISLTHTLMLAEVVAGKSEINASNLRSVSTKLDGIQEHLRSAAGAISESRRGIIDDRGEFFRQLQKRTFNVLGP